MIEVTKLCKPSVIRIPLRNSDIEMPEVFEHFTHADVVFHDLPRWGRVETLINLLYGITNLDEALEHFQLEHCIKHEMLTAHDKAISTQPSALGTVVTINLAKAEWMPGNTFIYILRPPHSATIPEVVGARTIYMGPTYFIEFDWQQASEAISTP